jgi:hypothetical protein
MDRCDDIGGAGVEAQMLSSRLYQQLASNAVIPIIRNNREAVVPAFLRLRATGIEIHDDDQTRSSANRRQ